LETPIIIHLLLDLGGLFGRNALVELFTVEEALEDKVRAALSRVARGGFEELLTEGTATEAVDRLHLLKEELPFLEERIELIWHGSYCIYIDTICKPQNTNGTVLIDLGYLRVTHPVWITASKKGVQ
jgi:hypothetical protein